MPICPRFETRALVAWLGGLGNTIAAALRIPTDSLVSRRRMALQATDVRHPALKRHAITTLLGILLAGVVVLLWVWLRLFVCWDEAFWGASVLCHLEVVAIVLLVVPLWSLFRLVRPHLDSDGVRAEVRDAAVRLSRVRRVKPSAAIWPRLFARCALFARYVKRRTYDSYATVPEDHRYHLRRVLPFLVVAVVVLGVFLWEVRFNLFWTY